MSVSGPGEAQTSCEQTPEEAIFGLEALLAGGALIVAHAKARPSEAIPATIAHTRTRALTRTWAGPSSGS